MNKEGKQSLADLISFSKKLVLANVGDESVYKKLDDRVLASTVFCTFLIQNQPESYKYISDKLKANLKFNIKIFEEILEDEFLYIIKYAPISIQKDSGFYWGFRHAEKSYRAYQILNYVSKEVLCDIENLLVILKEISRSSYEDNNISIDFILEEYRDNEELMLRFIQANSYCTLAISERLQNDENFIIKTIDLNDSAAKLMPDFYKKDISFLEKAIAINPEIFDYIYYFEILGIPENMLRILKTANVYISSIRSRCYFSNTPLLSNREFMDGLFEIAIDKQDDYRHSYLEYYDAETEEDDSLLTKEERKIAILIYGMIEKIKDWEYSNDSLDEDEDEDEILDILISSWEDSIDSLDEDEEEDKILDISINSLDEEEEEDEEECPHNPVNLLLNTYYKTRYECLTNTIYLLLDMYHSNKLQDSLCMGIYNNNKNSDSNLHSFKVADFETDCMEAYNIPLSDFCKNFYSLETSNIEEINYKKLSSFRLIHNYLIEEWSQKKQSSISFLNHSKRYKRVHFNKDSFKTAQSVLFKDEEFLLELAKVNSDYLKVMSCELEEDLDFAKKMINVNPEWKNYFNSEVAEQLSLDSNYDSINFYSNLPDSEKCKKSSILSALEFNEEIENIFTNTNIYLAEQDGINLFTDEDILRALFKNNSLEDSIFYDKENNTLDTAKLATLIKTDMAFVKKLLLDNNLFKTFFCNK